MKPIALDAMGGDFMPAAAVAGALEATRQGVEVILVGDEKLLAAELDRQGGSLPVHHAADVIGMRGHASEVKGRKEASVVKAMELTKRGESSACVSMGHSGATMAAALFALGRLKGVQRPAIAAVIPTGGRPVVLIDAGANADCRPSHLYQFAFMGSVYVSALFGLGAPKIGLMSIGEEPDKGNELTRGAHRLLSGTSHRNFVGNVQGRDLFSGEVDVIVTDGFTGNVMLKLAEGEAKALFQWVRDALTSSLPAKIGGALVKPALKRLSKRLDPAEYGAQPLLGVAGYAFIGHGSSDARAVRSALSTAAKTVSADLVDEVRIGLERIHPVPGTNADVTADETTEGPYE